jgi:hypothetical protein
MAIAVHQRPGISCGSPTLQGPECRVPLHQRLVVHVSRSLAMECLFLACGAEVCRALAKICEAGRLDDQQVELRVTYPVLTQAGILDAINSQISQV